MKDFHINTEIFFGENALDRLSALRFDSALIISDPFVVTSGMIISSMEIPPCWNVSR